MRDTSIYPVKQNHTSTWQNRRCDYSRLRLHKNIQVCLCYSQLPSPSFLINACRQPRAISGGWNDLWMTCQRANLSPCSSRCCPSPSLFFFLPTPHCFYEHIGQVKARAWQVGGCVCVRERQKSILKRDRSERGGGGNGIPLSLVKPGHATVALCRKMMPSIGRWANSNLTSWVKRVMKKTKNSCQIILMLFLQFCQLRERFCLDSSHSRSFHTENF